MKSQKTKFYELKKSESNNKNENLRFQKNKRI